MRLLSGRMNRAVFWLCVGILVVMFVGARVIFNTGMPINEVMLLFIGVPRLHDIGRTGWWMAAVLGVEAAGIAAAFSLLPLENAPIGLGLTTLVLFAIMAAIGLIPGQPFENRFGTPPAPGLGGRRRS